MAVGSEEGPRLISSTGEDSLSLSLTSHPSASVQQYFLAKLKLDYLDPPEKRRDEKVPLM